MDSEVIREGVGKSDFKNSFESPCIFLMKHQIKIFFKVFYLLKNIILALCGDQPA